MKSWIAAIAASCTIGCVSTDKAPEEAAEARPASPASPASLQQGGLAPCDESPATARLASYIDLQVPATVWVEMIFDSNEWRPAEHVPMPHHHATRLELENLADFPALSAHQRERLLFTVDIASREIHQVPGRREWRATYHARIVAVCIPK